MGIPSYFSYIVKNHTNIIKKFDKDSIQVDNLYLDCNSIIYDAVRSLKLDNMNDASIYNCIIRQVIIKIEEYISVISPSSMLYIAFDGVAPVAKLEQQRERRYKSWYQNEITRKIHKTGKVDPFNTTAITPGTLFMSELNKQVGLHFSTPSKYKLDRILFSDTNESGEGEHKLFEEIRVNAHLYKDSVNVIYGLDADLIMLSINHLPICSQIYLFRETPEFIKSINAELEPNEQYLMDIPELAKIITLNMNNGETLTTIQQNYRVYDYIFICFFLGNDFMPHFPSVNIRTGGVDKMINAYKATIGSTNECLTDGKTIYWKNVRKMVKFLADQEEKNLQQEMKSRDKREKMHYPSNTPEETFKKFEAIPTYEREVEKYICPFTNGWQKRYYKALFNVDDDELRKKQICTNYLEGLEWTMKYYTVGCPDWRWTYKYSYPPLLEDLLKYIPYFETTFVEPQPKNAVTPLVQLCYVLPKPSLRLLPEDLYDALIKEHDAWYRTDYEFVWAYCKFFWESHVEFPEIDINELFTFVAAYQSQKLLIK